MARARGIDIGERTLRYWAQVGLIPKPLKVKGKGNRAFYPASLVDRLAAIKALRGLSVEEIKRTLGRPVILAGSMRILPLNGGFALVYRPKSLDSERSTDVLGRI